MNQRFPLLFWGKTLVPKPKKCQFRGCLLESCLLPGLKRGRDAVKILLRRFCSLGRFVLVTHPSRPKKA